MSSLQQLCLKLCFDENEDFREFADKLLADLADIAETTFVQQREQTAKSMTLETSLYDFNRMFDVCFREKCIGKKYWGDLGARRTSLQWPRHASRIRKAVKELLTFTIIQGQNRVKEEHESSFQTEEGSTRPIFGIEKANEEVNEKTNATAPVPLSSYNIVKTGRKPRVRYTLSPLNDTAYEDDTEYEDDPGLLRCSNVAGSVPSGPFKRRSSTSYRLNALKRLHSSRRTTAPLQSALLRSIETPIRQVNTKSPATSISQINTKSRATSISQIDTKSPALSNYGLLTPPSFNNKPRVTFHFFLSDPNLGAITIPISECDTCTSFFNYAATAQALCGSKSHETTPGALSVNTGEFDWPIVVPWKDQRSFRKMIEFVRKAEDRSSEDLNIKVNYIKNG